MGILRRLREWREDKNGTLIGPDIEADSVDAGSVNTGQATISNRLAQNPESVELFADVKGESTISESTTISRNRGTTYRIEILDYINRESGNPAVKLTFSALSNGEYNYTLINEDGVFTPVSGDDYFPLIEPTAGISSDRHTASFELQVNGANRPHITGGGSPTNNGEGRYLNNSKVGFSGNLSDPFGLSIDVNSTDDADLMVAVWQSVDRRTI